MTYTLMYMIDTNVSFIIQEDRIYQADSVTLQSMNYLADPIPDTIFQVNWLLDSI